MSLLEIALTLAIALALALALAGCGSKGGSHEARATSASASGATDGAAADVAEPVVDPSPRARSHACAAAVLGVLRDIAERVYHEGVASERTFSALRLVETSVPLRAAVQRGDAGAARAAARSLLATGHLSNLLVMRGGRVLAEAGGYAALAPLHGTISGAAGAPGASFVASVWSDVGLVDEIKGLTDSIAELRASGQRSSGPVVLPRGALPAQGLLARRGVEYRYTSFPARAYPAGSSLRVYVLRSTPSTAALCGASREDAIVSTLSRVARTIYENETGPATLAQVRRVQHDGALLSAVARRESLGAKQAIDGLLNEHIVRLRVLVGGRVLSDVGGPFVLAPVRAPLRLRGRTIGTFVLSIQDDEGYLRLARRLAGLPVLMYMGGQLVKDSLGPVSGAVPERGAFGYGGRRFRLYTFRGDAFPAGPLRITVLIGAPYL